MQNSDKYFIDDSNQFGYGKCLVLTSPWESSYESVMKQEGISSIRVSNSNRSVTDDVSFLRELSGLVSVEIFSYFIQDVSAIESQPLLKNIMLDPGFKKYPDFSKLPLLESATIEWSKKVSGILDCPKLKIFRVWKFLRENFSEISHLTKIHTLEMVSSRRLISLEGISKLSRLRSLSLAICTSLTDLSGIGRCQALESVEIHSCRKVDDISELGHLKNLKVLKIENCAKIESLAPLASCGALEKLLFIGDCNILDGDFSPLLELPNLKQMWFMNRRHYSHTREEIKETLENRGL